MARALNKPDTKHYRMGALWSPTLRNPSLTDSMWKMIQHIQQSEEDFTEL